MECYDELGDKPFLDLASQIYFKLLFRRVVLNFECMLTCFNPLNTKNPSQCT